MLADGPLIKAMDGVTHLIVLSPHLDDGVLSCGALISYVCKHLPVTVATFFTDGCTPPYTYSARHYLRKSQFETASSFFFARRAEDQEVLASAGISYIHIGLPEALFRRRPRPLLNQFPQVQKLIPELSYIYPTYRLHVIRGALPLDDTETKNRIVEAIDRMSADSSTLFLAPLAVGGHKDHVLVRNAAHESGKRIAYYSDFPYNTFSPIGLSFARGAPLVKTSWSEDLVGKKSLIRGYRTQVEALFPSGEIPTVPEVYLLP